MLSVARGSSRAMQRSMLTCERHRGAQVVARAGFDVARLEADGHRPGWAGGEDPPQIDDVDRPVGIGGDVLDRGVAQTQQPQGPVDRGVPLHPGHDPDPRCPVSPWRSTPQPARARTSCRPLASPTVLAAWQPVTNPTLAGGEPEQLDEPLPSGFLGRRGGGRQHAVERALVPACGEHLPGGCARERPTDDEPEEAGPGRRHQSALGRRDQRLDDLPGRRRRAGQRPAEGRANRLDRLRCPHGTLRHPRPIPGGDRSGTGQDPSEIIHGSTLRRPSHSPVPHGAALPRTCVAINRLRSKALVDCVRLQLAGVYVTVHAMLARSGACCPPRPSTGRSYRCGPAATSSPRSRW